MANSKADAGSTSVVLTMRVRSSLYDELKVEAAKNGRSISDQAERRLKFPEDDIGRMVGLAISAVEDRMGSKWSASSAARDECRSAARTIIDLAFGIKSEEFGHNLDEILDSGSAEESIERLQTLCSAVEIFEEFRGKIKQKRASAKSKRAGK